MKYGNYVKCKNGRIAKVESIDKNFIYFDAEIYRQNGIAMHECETCFSEFIVKHSKNIIDLIEVGDIIVDDFTQQPYKVSKLTKDYIYCQCNLFKIRPNCIKSIVTKEQFKSIEYRLED